MKFVSAHKLRTVTCVDKVFEIVIFATVRSRAEKFGPIFTAHTGS